MFLKSTVLKSQYPCLTLYRYCHFESKLTPDRPQKIVAIFWDLDNKPPISFPPYEAAVRLKFAASSFGFVKYMVAYANRHAFSYVPRVVREHRNERKMLNQLENKGVIKPLEPYLCSVCGRKFYNNDKLVNHFKQIHEREHQKRLNQIESARGKRRVNLVAKYSMKMQKYKNAVRNVLTTKVGYGLADELKRAGFWVRTVSDKPQAADVALRDHMVDFMDKRKAECLVLVSDDSDFIDVLKEAKLRCLNTVVVGDINDGALKRAADVGFSWQEILMGKAKKEAPAVIGRWKDRDILKTLEWKYNPEEKKHTHCMVEDYLSEKYADAGNADGIIDDSSDDSLLEDEDDDGGAWWEVDSDSEVNSKVSGIFKDQDTNLPTERKLSYEPSNHSCFMKSEMNGFNVYDHEVAGNKGDGASSWPPIQLNLLLRQSKRSRLHATSVATGNKVAKTALKTRDW